MEKSLFTFLSLHWLRERKKTLTKVEIGFPLRHLETIIAESISAHCGPQPLASWFFSTVNVALDAISSPAPFYLPSLRVLPRVCTYTAFCVPDLSTGRDGRSPLQLRVDVSLLHGCFGLMVGLLLCHKEWPHMERHMCRSRSEIESVSPG